MAVMPKLLMWESERQDFKTGCIVVRRKIEADNEDYSVAMISVNGEHSLRSVFQKYACVFCRQEFEDESSQISQT